MKDDAIPTCNFLFEMSIPRSYTAIGFSPKNEVFYGKRDTATVIKYKLTPKKFKIEWEKTAPESAQCESYKFISKSGSIVFHYAEKTTYLTKSLDVVAQHEIENMYLEFVTDDKLFYVDGKPGCGNNEVVIDVYSKDKHQLLFSLRPPKPERKWSCYWYYAFTVCTTHGDGNVVVVDPHYNNIEIYNDKGTFIYKHLHKSSFR